MKKAIDFAIKLVLIIVNGIFIYLGLIVSLYGLEIITSYALDFLGAPKLSILLQRNPSAAYTVLFEVSCVAIIDFICLLILIVVHHHNNHNHTHSHHSKAPHNSQLPVHESSELQ